VTPSAARAVWGVARIKTDKRSLDYDPQPEVHARLVEGLAAWIRRELDLAKDFATILVSQHYYDEDCAGLMEYARKIGYDGRRAMVLSRTGQAMALDSRLEAEIESRRIPLESGPALYDALSHPVLRDKADWLALARDLSPGALGGHIRRLREEHARGTTKLRHLQALITEEDRDNLRRLRHLLMILRNQEVTEGETISQALDDSLDKRDPVRKARRIRAKMQKRIESDGEDPRARTARLEELTRELRKRSRYIPTDVVYGVLDRSNGECEIPGCARKGRVELMHLLVGYAEGGDPDPRNTGLGCPRHHRLVDAGRLRCVGFSDDERPIFEDSKGRVLYPDARPPPPKGPET